MCLKAAPHLDSQGQVTYISAVIHGEKKSVRYAQTTTLLNPQSEHFKKHLAMEEIEQRVFPDI